MPYFARNTAFVFIDYPATSPSIRRHNDRDEVFCAVRRRWYKCTPEEWVRQYFLLYLIEKKGLSPSRMAVEKSITVSGKRRRFDVVVYDDNFVPCILVECKEPAVELTETVLQQVLQYYSVVQSRYFIITNGAQTMVFLRQAHQVEVVDQWDF
ncbi:MAG: type I restriction enzyme HsdR N-terminal domain-containing protein [Ferruginibacter sp.]